MTLYYAANARLPTEKAHGHQILQMCQAFLENGQDVMLLGPNRNNSEELKKYENDLKEYYNLRRDITVERLPTWDLVPKVPVWTKFQMVAHLIQTWTFARSLGTHLKKQTDKGPVYLRDSNLLSFLLHAYPELRSRSFFLELHSLSKHASRFNRQISILKKCKGIVTVTNKMKEHLVMAGISGEKILVEHDAVDLKVFGNSISQAQARAKLNLGPQEKIASFVGKFHTNGEEKGIPEIIQAAALLLPQFPLLKFYFVGGPLARIAPYEKLINKLGLKRESFVFLEKRPLQEVPFYLAASDVLLMPHPWSEFYAYYVSPLKLFEYMASRRPIVASRLPSVMEILSHEENALLSEPGAPEEMATNIARLLKDENLREKLSKQAYNDVVFYTWENRANRILEFMEARSKS